MRHSLIIATALGAALLLAPPLAAQGMQDGTTGAVPTPGRDVEALLRQADAAVGRGNWVQATELVERAETSLLNTHVLGSNTAESGQTQGQALSSVGEARAAISRRDRNRARSALQAAVADAGRAGQQAAMPRAAERPTGGGTGGQTGPAAGAVGGGAAPAGSQLGIQGGTAGAVLPGSGTPGLSPAPGSSLR
jgi:hypothetical protein